MDKVDFKEQPEYTENGLNKTRRKIAHLAEKAQLFVEDGNQRKILPTSIQNSIGSDSQNEGRTLGYKKDRKGC